MRDTHTRASGRAEGRKEERTMRNSHSPGFHERARAEETAGNISMISRRSMWMRREGEEEEEEEEESVAPTNYEEA